MINTQKQTLENSQSDGGSIRKGSYRLRIIFSNIILVNGDLKCHTSYHRIHALCGSLERFILELILWDSNLKIIVQDQLGIMKTKFSRMRTKEWGFLVAPQQSDAIEEGGIRLYVTDNNLMRCELVLIAQPLALTSLLKLWNATRNISSTSKCGNWKMFTLIPKSELNDDSFKSGNSIVSNHDSFYQLWEFIFRWHSEVKRVKIDYWKYRQNLTVWL